MENITTFEKQIKRAVKFEDVKDLIQLCNDNSKKSEILKFKEYNGKKLIHFAAIFGSLELLKILVDLGADLTEKVEVRFCDDKGENVLQIACRHGNIEVVDYLLRCMPMLSSDKTNSTGHSSKYRNAFYFAAKSGNPEIVKSLINIGGMNINKIFLDGKTSLLTLVVENDHKGAEVLCQCGANVNLGTFDRGLKAIHYAAEKSYSDEMIKVLIKYGANVNLSWSSRKTGLYQLPLFMSLKKGNNKNVKALLECGADVNAGGRTSNTAMGWIGCFSLAAKRCPSLIPEFLKHGANPNECHNGETILMVAMDKCLHDKATIEALVKAGANINKGRCGKTAIQCCETYDQLLAFIRGGITVEVIEKQHKISTLLLALKQNDHRYTRPNKDVSSNIIELLSWGANPNISKEKEDSPLIVATLQGLADVVDILLQAGAKVDHIGSDGKAAIHISCISGAGISKWQIIKSLISYGTCLNTTNEAGGYPLELLLDNYNVRKPYYGFLLSSRPTDQSHDEIEECISKMMVKGANPNIVMEGKDSPLMVAIQKGLDNVAFALIDGGADVTHVGKDNMTVVDTCLICEESGRQELMKRLIEKGLNVNTVTLSGKPMLNVLIEAGIENPILVTMLEKGANPNMSCPGEDSALFKCIGRGNYDLACVLLESGADVNYRNSKGKTAFDEFAESAQRLRRKYSSYQTVPRQLDKSDPKIKVLKCFMDFGVEINRQTNKKVCPLLLAVVLGSEELVKWMLDNGADPNLMEGCYETPLSIAITDGMDGIVGLLLNAKANVNYINQQSNKLEVSDSFVSRQMIGRGSHENTDSCSLLSRVIRNMPTLSIAEKEKYVELLLTHGANPNLENTGRDTPLIHAVKIRSLQLVKRLLEAGANVNHVGEKHCTALQTYFQTYPGIYNRHTDRYRGSLMDCENDQEDIRCTDGDGIMQLLLGFGASMEKYSDTFLTPLHRALEKNAFANDFSDILLLLDYTPKTIINLPHENKDSPLVFAARYCNADVIQKIIFVGADTNYKGSGGNTALHVHMSAREFDRETVSLLLKHGACLNSKNDNGETPLFCYIKKGKRYATQENVLFLLNNGADPNECDKGRDSPLIAAINENMHTIVGCLIEAKSDVNHVGEYGRTALHSILNTGYFDEHEESESCTLLSDKRSTDRSARSSPAKSEAENYVLETVTRLIGSGASVNAVTEDGKSPLSFIDMTKIDCTILQMLLEHGADPNAGTDVPIITAALFHNYSVVQSLLISGAVVDKKNSSGETALMAALEGPWLFKAKGLETIKILLDAGGSANMKDNDGNSPLSIAIKQSRRNYESVNQVLLLLNRGGNPNSENIGDNSLLMMAVENFSLPVAKALIKAGANVNHIGKDGETALHKCFLRKGRMIFFGPLREILKLLLSNGADVNTAADGHDSPLHLVIKRNIVDAVKILLQAGADPFYKGQNGLNAFEACLNIFIPESKNSWLEILELLLNHHQLGEYLDNFFQKFWEFIRKENWNNIKLIDKIGSKLLSSEENVNVNFGKKFEDSPLIFFCKNQCVETFKLLVVREADINHCGMSGMTTLHHIVALSDCKTAEAMLDAILPQQSRFDIVDKTGRTALDIVIKNLTKYDKDIFYVSSALIQRFLKAGAKVKAEDMLLVNAIRGDFQGMEFLIRHGANKYVKMRDGKSILHLCWSNPLGKALQFLEFYVSTGGVFKNIEGKRSILMALLKSGDVSQNNFETRDNQVANLVTFLLKHNAFCGTENGDSPLHIAAKNGYATTIGALIESGCDPCACNEEGDTALHICLKNPKSNVSKVISKLLKNKESIDICNKSGETPLYLATVYRKDTYGYNYHRQTSHREETGVSSEDMIKILLDHGANPNKHTPNKIPLLAAVENKDIKSTILLLESGADVNATQNRKSALHILFGKYDNKEIDESFFQILLEKGIDVNLVDTEERTALFAAVKKYTDRRYDKDNASLFVKLKNIISALVHHGADINHIDNSFETVLSIFCESGTIGSVGTFMLEVGADPTKGRYIHSAIRNYSVDSNISEWEDFICALLQKGADPNAHSKSEPNLITATKRGLTRVVGMMLEHGADVNAKDCVRKTALHHACSLDTTKGRDDIIQLLDRSGASLVLSSSDGGNPLDILVQNVIKNIKTSEFTTSEYGNLQIEVDLTSFNLLVKGGCDSKPVIASKQERSRWVHVGSYIDKDEMLAGEDEDRSIILLLIKNGLLKAAEYLIQSGWDIQNESWFESFDVSQLDLATVKVKGSDYKRSDIDAKIKDLQTLIKNMRKEPTSLAMQCRKVVRKQLLEASKGTSIEAKVFLLPLPEKIKSFVSINDHIQPKEIIELEEKSKITPYPSIDVMRVLSTKMFSTGSLFPTTLTYGDYNSDEDYDDDLL